VKRKRLGNSRTGPNAISASGSSLEGLAKVEVFGVKVGSLLVDGGFWEMGVGVDGASGLELERKFAACESAASGVGGDREGAVELGDAGVGEEFCVFVLSVDDVNAHFFGSWDIRRPQC